MHGHFACKSFCAQSVCRACRGQKLSDLWNWSYKQGWAAMWLLALNPVPLEEQAVQLNTEPSLCLHPPVTSWDDFWRHTRPPTLWPLSIYFISAQRRDVDPEEICFLLQQLFSKAVPLSIPSAHWTPCRRRVVGRGAILPGQCSQSPEKYSTYSKAGRGVGNGGFAPWVQHPCFYKQSEW